MPEKFGSSEIEIGGAGVKNLGTSKYSIGPYPTIANHIQHYQTISKAFAVWPIKIGWCDEECAHAKEFGLNKSEFGRRGSNWVKSCFAQLVQTFNLCSKKVFALLTKRTRWMVR